MKKQILPVVSIGLLVLLGIFLNATAPTINPIPYMVSGQPSSKVIITPATVQADFQNNKGVFIRNDLFRFIDFYKNLYTVGIQQGANYFYVWSRGNKKPICEGVFQNYSGTTIDFNKLSHMVVGSFDDTGRTQVFAQHSEEGWYYIWDLGKLDASGTSCSRTFHYRPVSDGRLYNYSGVEIKGKDLTYLIVTDWDNDGINELQGFQKNNPWSILWSGTGATPKLSFLKDMKLETNVNDIIGITSNRRGEDWSNVPHETELYLQTKKGYEYINQNGPLGVTLACAPKNQDCAGKSFYLSLDQGFESGPVNTFRYPDKKLAVRKLIRQVSQIAKQFRAKGVKFSVIINPSHKDKSSLIAFLDELVAAEIPFIFDMVASDSVTNYFNYKPYVEVFSPFERLALDVEMQNPKPTPQNIRYYMNRYKSWLTGYRVFEQMAVSLGHEYCRYYHQKGQLKSQSASCWKYLDNGDSKKAPFIAKINNPYRSDSWNRNIKILAQYALSSKRILLWSDNHHFNMYENYHRSYPAELKKILGDETAGYRAYMQKIANSYPDTVVAT